MQKEKTPLSGIVDLSDHLNLYVIKRNLHSYRNEGGGWEGKYDPARLSKAMKNLMIAI